MGQAQVSRRLRHFHCESVSHPPTFCLHYVALYVHYYVILYGRQGAKIGQHESETKWHAEAWSPLAGRAPMTYTIFEGTSEIQRLIIARAISGVHIQ